MAARLAARDCWGSFWDNPGLANGCGRGLSYHHACWTGGPSYTSRSTAGREAETRVATGGQTTDQAGAPEIQTNTAYGFLPRRSAGGAAHTRWRLSWGTTSRWWSLPLPAHLLCVAVAECYPMSRTVQAGDTTTVRRPLVASGLVARPHLESLMFFVPFSSGAI